MDIHESRLDDVAILYLSGDVWGRSDEPEKFRSTVKQLVSDGKLRVVLNLSQVRLISSVGLGMLISGYKILSGSGGNMAIAQPSDPIKPVFKVFESPIQCFEADDDAIAFLRGQGA
ncbi:MAG: STAS domain-containing protein [Candidatus Krumholzibacteriia bacterium]